MSTTRWKDTRVENIEEAINSLMAPIPDDEDTSNISRKNWKMVKLFSNNETITLLEKSVEFNIVNFSYDKITNTGLEKNRVPQTGFIIVYSIENQVNYIINRNSEAKLILRKMLSYNGRNEIDNNSFMIDSDFFLWLINRIYYANNEIDVGEEPSSVLKINAIKGFQGDTEDSQTTVTASGESVMLRHARQKALCGGGRCDGARDTVPVANRSERRLCLVCGLRHIVHKDDAHHSLSPSD